MTLYSEGYFERAQGSNYTCYSDDPGWPLTASVLADDFQGKHVLEIGCAKGFFVAHARRRGMKCIGVDVSQYAVTHSPQEVAPFLAVADTAALPFFAASFDLVVSWETLEHVPAGDIYAAWEGMDRVLKPGGLMIHRIATLDDGDAFYSDATHVLEWTQEQWRRWFDMHKYDRVETWERCFNKVFADRDWAGRYFAYRKPLEVA